MSRSLEQHLDPAHTPKRILALDGGGTRGVIEIAFLEKIEAELKTRSGRGDDFRLSDYFDLIGGTSTGAIVATALALGMRAREVRDLYLRMGEAIFRRSPFHFLGVSPRFYARGLGKVLSEVLAERTLDSPDLRTGLAIIAKRLDTGSPWVLTNNPRSMYWSTSDADAKTGKEKSIGNSAYKIRDVVRASAAAPFYFAPKIIQVSATEPGLFVDGGVSPHNNPALQLFMLAGIKGYGFNWPTDKDKLLLVSLGQDASPEAVDRKSQAPAIGTLGGRGTQGHGLGLPVGDVETIAMDRGRPTALADQLRSGNVVGRDTRQRTRRPARTADIPALRS